MYVIIKEDHIDKKSTVLEKFYSLHNAVQYIELEIERYIIYQQGSKQFKIYDEKAHIQGNLNSRRFNNYPYGYLVFKSERISNQYIIYLKEIDSGYIYNSYKISKIFVLTICECTESKKLVNDYPQTPPTPPNSDESDDEKKNTFDNVLNELIKNKKFLSLRESNS